MSATRQAPRIVRTIRRWGGSLMVLCPKCRKSSPLGGYGAAHLGRCELQGTYQHCGVTQIIPREIKLP